MEPIVVAATITATAAIIAATITTTGSLKAAQLKVTTAAPEKKEAGAVSLRSRRTARLLALILGSAAAFTIALGFWLVSPKTISSTTGMIFVAIGSLIAGFVVAFEIIVWFVFKTIREILDSQNREPNKSPETNALPRQ